MGIEKWKTRLAFLPIVLGVAGCTNEAPSETPADNFSLTLPADPEEIACNLPPLPDSLKNGAHSLEGAILLLEAHNRLENSSVGYAGSESKVFQAADIVRKQSANEQLFKLLKSESPATRVYAFVILTQRDSTLWDRAWEALRGKEDKVYTLDCCDGGVHTVELLCIAPLDFVENPVQR